MGGELYITHTFREHDDYERTLKGKYKADFIGGEYIDWRPTAN